MAGGDAADAGIAAGTDAALDAAVTQFAVLDALLAGAYASGMPVETVPDFGDLGIGCCDLLGGEVVILDGDVYECTADAAPRRMATPETLPFVDVCPWHPSPPHPVAGLGLAALTARVEETLISRNLFHAVRIDGVFDVVRTRVTRRQQAPLPPLAEVAAHQLETELVNAAGTLVGFWTPAIYQGIAVAGLHLHFLSAGRSAGGHMLDVGVREAELRIAAYSHFHLRLPGDPLFLRTELTHGDDHRIVAVEGGAGDRISPRS